MRIVLLPSAFAPQIGGVEILTDNLARSLISAGHELEIWTSRSADDELRETELIDGLCVRRFVFEAPRVNLIATMRWGPRAGRTLWQMRNAVRDFRPDVLHVQCFGPNGIYAALISGVVRVPLVVTLQGETFMDDHEIYQNSLFLRTGLRYGLRQAARVTACSRFTLEDAVQRFGLDAAKARVIFNGVDLELERSPARVPFDRFVLALGRLVHRKGFDLLVDAWSQIADRHDHTGLVLGGIGPELPRLQALVAARGLEGRVHFAGKLSSAQVAEVMNAAEIFVMPSRLEAFGIVVLEAWRSHTPVIVTANGGPREFVEDGVTGVVVDPTKPELLGAALDRLLIDTDLRLRMAEAASACLPKFAWPKIRDIYEDVYRSTAAQTFEG